MKLCIKCSQHKPFDAFHLDRRRPDGRFPYCRECRTGSPNPRKRKDRRRHSNGYWLINAPGHFLAASNGYIYEHRKVLFDAVGHSISECDICGKEWAWSDIYGSHVDHIDEDKSNNAVENLRPLCNACNTQRGVRMPEYMKKGRTPITYNGKTQTSEEWAREDVAVVPGHTIRSRIKSGWSAELAITKPSRKGKA